MTAPQNLPCWTTGARSHAGPGAFACPSSRPIFTAAEVVVPLFGDVLPRGVFVLLAFSASIGAAIARLVAQPEMHR
jgi:hypothetical protein